MAGSFLGHLGARELDSPSVLALQLCRLQLGKASTALGRRTRGSSLESSEKFWDEYFPLRDLTWACFAHGTNVLARQREVDLPGLQFPL